MTVTEEITPNGSERYNMLDGQRKIIMTGWQLGQADSQSGYDVRWTELAMYRTLTGKYVIEKIGRSDVFHSEKCTRNRGAKFTSLKETRPPDAEAEETLEDLFAPCDQCKPDYDISPVYVERDLSSVNVFDTAQTAIEFLYRPDSAGSKRLSRVARDLLTQAAENDDVIRGIMTQPTDIT